MSSEFSPFERLPQELIFSIFRFLYPFTSLKEEKQFAQLLLVCRSFNSISKQVPSTLQFNYQKPLNIGRLQNFDDEGICWPSSSTAKWKVGIKQNHTSLVFYEITTRKILSTLTLSQPVQALALTPRAYFAVVIDTMHDAWWIDMATEKIMPLNIKLPEVANNAKLTPDGKYLLYVADEIKGEIGLKEVRTGKKTHVFYSNMKDIRYQLTDDGDHLIVSNYAEIQVWDMAKKNCLWKTTMRGEEIFLDADNKSLYFNEKEATPTYLSSLFKTKANPYMLVKKDIHTGKNLLQLTYGTEEEPVIFYGGAISPDKKYIVLACRPFIKGGESVEYQVRIYCAETQKLLSHHVLPSDFFSIKSFDSPKKCFFSEGTFVICSEKTQNYLAIYFSLVSLMDLLTQKIEPEADSQCACPRTLSKAS